MITITTKICNTFFQINETNSKFDTIMNGYYNYIDCNNFDNLRCPCCKNKKTLKFHKYYNRNITIIENDIRIDKIIQIAVVECTYCKKVSNKQKYHALLPEFILPYHLYEASVIVDAIYQQIIKNKKIEEILNRIQITHKLYYEWLRKIKKYLLASSIILNEKNQIKEVINKMFINNDIFLIDFFNNYEHPYFLFKQTCVPLCIIP